MAKRKWTPEEQSAWKAEKAASAEARRQLAISLDRYDRWLDERRQRYERRRRLVNRLSFGLVARR
jgi:hypothetical protein